MKIDPYKNEEKYLTWKESGAPIEDISKTSREMIIDFLDDMENGLNVNTSNKKGSRSYIRLNAYRSKLKILARILEQKFKVNLKTVKKEDAHKLFKGMEKGEFKRTNGKMYSDPMDYLKTLKAYWHWYQKKYKIEGLSYTNQQELFLRQLLSSCNFEIGWNKISNEIAAICSYGYKGMPTRKGFNATYTAELKLYYLSSNGELSEPTIFNGLNFNENWNTRSILLSEGCLELEKGSYEDNLKATWATIESLIKNDIEFYVFYAEGMRTPHIHIYGLFPNVNDWAEKEMCMALFCRRIVPFEYFHLLDTALFGEHTIALEFSKHYKYGTIYRLVWWNIPQGAACSN